jgi:hypothetical protein
MTISPFSTVTQKRCKANYDVTTNAVVYVSNHSLEVIITCASEGLSDDPVPSWTGKLKECCCSSERKT